MSKLKNPYIVVEEILINNINKELKNSIYNNKLIKNKKDLSDFTNVDINLNCPKLDDITFI